MSGIAGFLSLDQTPVDTADLQRMSEALARRGPRGSHAWNDVSVGLILRSLHSSTDTDPLMEGTECSPIVLVTDARIDNRDELVHELRLDGGEGKVFCDSDLIRHAYRRWGMECPEHLLGDFAFAVWDAGEGRLFAARDAFGVKPFYFHLEKDRRFVFASEIKAITAVRSIPRRLNDVRIADYLAGMCTDDAYTFYQDIERLPAGHSLSISQGSFRLRRFASIEPDPELRLASDGEYAEAFRDRFMEAVRCRLRSPDPVAVTLSGGLDSSSIACVASRLLGEGSASHVQTFSTIFEAGAPWDEREYIEEVLNRTKAVPHYVRARRYAHRMFDELDAILRYLDEPFWAPNAVQPWNLYRTISNRKIHVALDGHGGDEVVSQGNGYLRELASSGRWISLARELLPLSRAYDEPFWDLLTGYVRQGVRSSSRRSVMLAGAIGRRLRAPVRRTPSLNGPSFSLLRHIAPELARRSDLPRRHAEWVATQAPRARSEREHHLRTICNPARSYSFEILDKLAHAFAVEPRYPFYDRRLVTFCLALPPEQKLRNGWGRYVLRRAMEGILPRKIQWRRDKADFSAHLVQSLRLDKCGPSTGWPDLSDDLKEYVDEAEIRKACVRLADGRAGGSELGGIVSAMLLGRWLATSRANGVL